MGFLSATRPPTEKVHVEQWALGTFAELRLLRASLRQALAGQPMPDGRVLDNVPEKMAIVATELAANAMAHARPPTTVRLFRTETTFILDVADNDPWVIPRFPTNVRCGPAGWGCKWLASCRSTSVGMSLTEQSTYGRRSRYRWLDAVPPMPSSLHRHGRATWMASEQSRLRLGRWGEMPPSSSQTSSPSARNGSPGSVPGDKGRRVGDSAATMRTWIAPPSAQIAVSTAGGWSEK